MKNFEAISLFSGAGGLDIGSEAAGLPVSHCFEIDRDSCETLRINSCASSREIHEGDISDFNFSTLASGAPKIILGGPPCQPFSKNGYWVKNENRKVELDPRNLLDQFIRAVDETNCAAFLFENVDSILHPTNKKTLERFLSLANEIGYSTRIYRSLALDFGVPQKRRRVFVFGIKGANREIGDPMPTHKDPEKVDLLASNLPDHPNVGTFIEKFDTEKYCEPYEDASKGTYFEELCAVSPGTNYMSLTDQEGYTGRTFEHGKRFWNFLYKLSPDKPSITIAAQPGPWVGPFHWNNRRLRVPEIAAIQTFPEEYVFYGSRRSVQKQIGNAVPCLLAQRMVEHLLEHI